MIKYRLTCKKCNFNFDSWFASSVEYEKLKKKKLLSCINCNSKNVDKSLMAPKLINRLNVKTSEKKNLKSKKIYSKIQEYQKFIKNNFKNVGENFAFEARSIHYGKKKSKGIYGTATKEEIKELKEEGIETEMIPWIKNKDN